MFHNKLPQGITLVMLVFLLVNCGVPTPIVIVVTATSQATQIPSMLLPPTFQAIPTSISFLYTAPPESPAPIVKFAGDNPVVQVTTNLGVDTTIEISSIDTGDDILNSLARNIHGQYYIKLPLKIADGFYLLIPIETFHRAYRDGDMQMVVLSNGQELRGTLEATIKDADGRLYDLRTANSLVLSSLPINIETPVPTEQNQELWQIHITDPLDFTYNVLNPRFAFQYYSGAGYIMGGTNRETVSSSFYLKIGEAEEVANIPDFEQLIFSHATEDENKTQVKVRSRSGVETIGNLVLKAQDSAGNHEGGNRFLIMNFADSSGWIVVLKGPVCSLSRIRQ